MKIGLFPLNIVLFPESIYPLHIFEDRYKKLLSECSEKDKEFGVVYANGNNILSIGCTAKVHKLIKKYDDGKMDLNVIGRSKYLINDIEEHEDGLLVGDVKILDDMDEKLDETLLNECLELYNFITNKIPVFRVQRTTKETLEGKLASYYFAQKSGLIAKQKQALLEMNSENLRLDYIRKHLESIKPSVDKAVEVEKIIRNDGYLPPKEK